MKKKIFLLLSILFISQFYAQMVSNVRVSRDPDCGYYKISFDLNGKEERTYLISFTATNGNEEIKNPEGLKGEGISEACCVGPNRVLFWYPELFGYEKTGWQFIIKAIDSNFVFVEGGTFQMGSNNGEDSEKPIHTVILSPFYIGKYEVTKSDWSGVMNKDKSTYEYGEFPIEYISWYDAIEYCNKLSLKEGLTPCYSGKGKNIKCDWSANGYRLPTEAEWEYAARGGIKSKGFKYSGSNDIDEVAWYNGNSNNTSHKVGEKKPNELGIYDMSGNIYEYCWDWLDKDYYRDSVLYNPKGPGKGIYKIIRGGDYYNNKNFCLVSKRKGITPKVKYCQFGFRVVRANL
jgi:formylglycine-generating enzyme required for sulfatase activity